MQTMSGLYSKQLAFKSSILKYGESLARCCLTVVGVCLMLSKIITIGWLLVRVTGEGVSSSVVCTLEPLGSEIVTHDPRSQTLQKKVFDLVQAMRIKDGNEGVMVSNNREVAQSSEEEMALLDRPCNCQAFQLNNSISAFCIGEEPRSSLHHPPVRVVIGWLLEKEEAQTEGASIRVEAGLLGGVKVG